MNQIQKLQQPHKEEVKGENDITHTVVYHPTGKELVDKVNEIIDYLSTQNEKEIDIFEEGARITDLRKEINLGIRTRGGKVNIPYLVEFLVRLSRCSEIEPIETHPLIKPCPDCIEEKAHHHKKECKNCTEEGLCGECGRDTWWFMRTKEEPKQIEVEGLLEEYAQIYGGFNNWHSETLEAKHKRMNEIINTLKQAIQQ